ncbi:Unknown protein sequence [Pseudomonas syringae pv. syringae]|nr:Unknown protein sequence [Pseudomonas syringae pv. syringae]
MRIDPRAQPPPLKYRHRRLDLAGVHRACRRDQCHGVASSQSPGVKSV